MPQPIELLARMAFGGIEFPVESYTLRGSARHHVHVYARVPGGDIEKLGRNLYEVEARVLFLTSATSYPNLWPDRLAAFRRICEAEETSELVIPTVGSIEAECTNWEQLFTSNVLNGERATFRFLEDQSAAFLIEGLITVQTKSLASTTKALEVTLEQALRDQNPSQQDKDLFDVLLDTSNEILAVRDRVELGGFMIQEKLGALQGLCAEAERTVRMFDDALNYTILDSLKDLWAAAQGVAEALTGPSTDFAYYVVPQRMTVQQAAAAITATTRQEVTATDLLQLNSIANAFDILAGTRLRYLLTSSLTAAA